LEENINIKSIYGQEKYNELREIGYHFEFIGTLVRRKIIHFKVIFDIISFPDDLWLKTSEFRKVMKRSYFRDFWENFGYLNSDFQRERKKLLLTKYKTSFRYTDMLFICNFRSSFQKNNSLYTGIITPQSYPQSSALLPILL
jgi:hypothetical protein